MKRTLLFALSIALVACGDDASSKDDAEPGAETKDAAVKDGSQATKDASSGANDAASDLLDAALNDSATDQPDAVVTAPDANVPVDASSPLDAQVIDSGIDAAADAQMCVAEGERCGAGGGTCCEGTACVTTADKPYDICVKSCTADSECETGCCSDNVCAAADVCEEDDATAPLTGINCYDNLKVYDHSGTYLGKATSSTFATEGVCNQFGKYGKNGSSSDNIWDYGSDAQGTSLFFSAVLGCGSNFPVLAYVSKYTGQSDKRVVSPDNLCEVLKNSNL